VKRIFICLTAVAALGGIVYCGTIVGAQPVSPPAAAPAQMRPRIALVNIAKVLRDFAKASAEGKIITAKRQYYVDEIKPLREMLAAKSRQIQQTVQPTEKEKLQKEAVAINRKIEDLDQEAQRVLGELTDRTIIEVYQNIKTTINDIAVTNNLDLVMCYPDASDVKDEMKPQIISLKLQTPALMPFYHRGMDITQVVVDTLNKRHPAPPVPVTAPSSPMGRTDPKNSGVLPATYPKRP
jgi:Skp family chaperone for outer membrane proteins